MRQRVVEATYACVARRGLGATTVDHVVQASGVSRATVYRHFPGGRAELLTAAIAWETNRFFLRLAEAVAGSAGFAAVLADGLAWASRAVAEHELLQRLLASEPERLLPVLTVQVDRLIPFVAAFIQPYLAEATLRPGVEEGEAAEYLARMLLSHINAPGRWQGADHAALADLVSTEFLAGVTEVTTLDR